MPDAFSCKSLQIFNNLYCFRNVYAKLKHHFMLLKHCLNKPFLPWTKFFQWQKSHLSHWIHRVFTLLKSFNNSIVFCYALCPAESTELLKPMKSLNKRNASAPGAETALQREGAEEEKHLLAGPLAPRAGQTDLMWFHWQGNKSHWKLSSGFRVYFYIFQARNLTRHARPLLPG